MTPLSRRSFLTTSALATAGLASLTGCSRNSNNTTDSRPRFHPLEGLARENLKITDVKVLPLSYVDPNRNLWRSGDMIVWKTDGAITQIFTDQGIIGIGEGTPYQGPDYLKEFTEKEIRPLLIGKNPFDIELYNARGSSRHERAPWAGIDCALWDIIGKVKGVPVYQLLATHNEPRTEIPVYASGGDYHEWYDNGEETLINEALSYKEQGYDCFKFRQGTSWQFSNMTLEKYIPILGRLREAVGPDFRLCHESMGATGVPMDQVVKEFCPALEELGFYWFEEGPGGTLPSHMDIFRQFNEAMPNVMVTGGERFLNRFESQIWLDEGLLDIIQTDCNVTGVTENWYISQMAHARGIHSIPHNWHGGGTTMSNAHFTAAIPNGSYCELNQTYNRLLDQIFKEPYEVKNGMLKLSDKPGYGVELIDDIEKKFPFAPGTYRRPNPRIQK